MVPHEIKATKQKMSVEANESNTIKKEDFRICSYCKTRYEIAVELLYAGISKISLYIFTHFKRNNIKFCAEFAKITPSKMNIEQICQTK